MPSPAAIFNCVGWPTPPYGGKPAHGAGNLGSSESRGLYTEMPDSGRVNRPNRGGSPRPPAPSESRINSYGAYKSSEIEWLGKIPTHWAIGAVVPPADGT